MTPPFSSGGEASNGTLIRRLFALSWRYRRGCILILTQQAAMLALGLLGLGFTGIAIDVMRHAVNPTAPVPKWPLHFSPPPQWTPMHTMEIIAIIILVVAA